MVFKWSKMVLSRAANNSLFSTLSTRRRSKRDLLLEIFANLLSTFVWIVSYRAFSVTVKTDGAFAALVLRQNHEWLEMKACPMGSTKKICPTRSDVVLRWRLLTEEMEILTSTTTSLQLSDWISDFKSFKQTSAKIEFLQSQRRLLTTNCRT